MFGKQKIQQREHHLVKMVLAIGLVIAALLAGVGVFYYYVIFAPELEQQKLDLEQQKIKQMQEVQKALKKKQWQVEQRKLVYQNCINDADQAYANQWANSCQQLAEQNRNNIENCLNDPRVKYHPFRGEAYCMNKFGDVELSVDCHLPIEIADQLERIKAQAKEVCVSKIQNVIYE